MAIEDVAVVGVPVAAAPEGERQLAQLGPFSVSRGSATGLKATLAALLATNLVLALGLVLAFLRGSRIRREAEEAAARDAKK
jgi:hypothetical protein